MTRKISIASFFDYNLPIEKQISLASQAGFTHFTFSANYEHCGILDRNEKALKEVLKNHHLSVDTIHGPTLDKDDAFPIIKRLCTVANELEVPVMVLHCSCFAFRQEQYTQRKQDISEKIQKLESISKETGIRFALENVLPGPATELVKEMVLCGDPRYIGFCYDSAHDQIDGPNPFTLLEELKDRLFTAHISDRLREFEDHVIPGEGFIDFTKMCEILRGSSLNPPLLTEVMMTHSEFKEHQVFLKNAYEQACELHDRIWG
ncbi:MAG: hypothetical protein BGN88_08715 [Clostridiales bacterium 43-6]|nr:MAG: hypothetical protein BGN88_08715 [Clostridiales bacterium 43-6]